MCPHFSPPRLPGIGAREPRGRKMLGELCGCVAGPQAASIAVFFASALSPKRRRGEAKNTAPTGQITKIDPRNPPNSRASGRPCRGAPIPPPERAGGKSPRPRPTRATEACLGQVRRPTGAGSRRVRGVVRLVVERSGAVDIRSGLGLRGPTMRDRGEPHKYIFRPSRAAIAAPNRTSAHDGGTVIGGWMKVYENGERWSAGAG